MKVSNLLMLGTLLLVTISCRNGGSESKIPDTYVVMVSFDGFRWDYTDLYETPQFHDLARKGVKAQWMVPSFPTKTFPNHYTLATGLYPDHHGIIENSFYAAELDGIYRIGDPDMVTDPDAYFGEPIWVTAEEQGVKTASYFWVGSEAPIRGTYPSYWEEYNESVPYRERIDQVIQWLKLPEKKRPGLVMLYFDQPDGIGHDLGPLHEATGEMITSLDSLLGYLRSEIASLSISDRINLIVLSDHGMGATSPDRYINLYDHIQEGWTESVIGSNPVYLIDPVDACKDSIIQALQRVEGLLAWQKEDIPEHLHYGDSPRFPGILVVADTTWSIGTRSNPQGYTGGAHGYDQHFTQMRTIFYAEGPAFKEGYTAPAFPNVDVYHIISHILDLEPAENDGRLERVLHMFSEE